MAVYVDALKKYPRSKKWPYGEACHMLADSVSELHAFARKIGLKRHWFQDGTLPHYDLTRRMRGKAFRAGARVVTDHDVADLVEESRAARRILVDLFS